MVGIAILYVIRMAVHQSYQAIRVAFRVKYHLLMKVEFRDVPGVSNMKTRSITRHGLIAYKDVFVIQVSDIEVPVNLFLHQLFKSWQVDLRFL